MENISLPKRLFYRYLGVMYWLIHWTDVQKVLEVRLGTVIRWFSLAVPILGWIQGWHLAGMILALLFILWIQFSYWRGRRSGYFRFVGETADPFSSAEITPMQKNKHIPVCATGIFSLKDWEENVVFRPAEYWQVPLGDHAIKVEHAPGRFLYQFISADLMQDMQKGWLLFGSRPNRAISVTFLSIWGPEFSDENFSLGGNSRKKAMEKVRKIYLSFEEDEHEVSVWNNLLFDARRVRSVQV